MSRKRKQNKRVAAPAPVEIEAVPEEILADGSGPVAQGDAAELAEAANAVGRRRKRRGAGRNPVASTGAATPDQSDEVSTGDENGTANGSHRDADAEMAGADADTADADAAADSDAEMADGDDAAATVATTDAADAEMAADADAEMAEAASVTTDAEDTADSGPRRRGRQGRRGAAAARAKGTAEAPGRRGRKARRGAASAVDEAAVDAASGTDAPMAEAEGESADVDVTMAEAGGDDADAEMADADALMAEADADAGAEMVDADADASIDADVEAAAEAAGAADLEAAAEGADEAGVSAAAEADVAEAGEGAAGSEAASDEGGEVDEAAMSDEEAGELGVVLPTSAASMDAEQLKHLVEALVFASDKPLTVQRLRQLTRVSDTKRLEQALAAITEDFSQRGIVLQQVSGGYQFRTRTQFSSWVQQLIAGRPVRLSRAQLETLAIIAYRQPITRPEIDDIRGVDSSATLKLLIDRSLIRILGKKEEVGRPMLYGTTKEFLDFFSLGDLRELPTLREYSELTDESRQVMRARLGLELDNSSRPTGDSEPGSEDGDDGSGGGGSDAGGSNAGGSDAGGSNAGGSNAGGSNGGHGGGFGPNGFGPNGFGPNGFEPSDLASSDSEVSADVSDGLSESLDTAAEPMDVSAESLDIVAESVDALAESVDAVAESVDALADFVIIAAESETVFEDGESGSASERAEVVTPLEVHGEVSDAIGDVEATAPEAVEVYMDAASEEVGTPQLEATAPEAAAVHMEAVTEAPEEAAEVVADAAVVDGPEWPEGSGRVGDSPGAWIEPAVALAPAAEVAEDEAEAMDSALVAEQMAERPPVEPTPE